MMRMPTMRTNKIMITSTDKALECVLEMGLNFGAQVAMAVTDVAEAAFREKEKRYSQDTGAKMDVVDSGKLHHFRVSKVTKGAG